MTEYLLRYREGTDCGRRFPDTTFPWRGPGYPTEEAAEQVRQQCPNGDQMEIIPKEGT